MFRIKLITETSTYLKKYFLQIRVRLGNRSAIDEVDCLLACDSTALYAGELDGKPIGICAVFKYENGYQHAGGLYIEDKYRESGYGFMLSHELYQRSKPFKNLSCYALPHMAETYKKYFGFREVLCPVESHDLNITTVLKKLQGMSLDATYHVKQVSDVDFETLFNYDKLTFGYNRKQFLYKWLYSPASRSCVVLNNEGCVLGYIVARKSMVSGGGYMIGPLFCQDIDVAKVLIQSVLQEINEEGTTNSVVLNCLIGKNPQVKELLTFLDSTIFEKSILMSTNAQLKGHVDKWFAITSFMCG